MIRQIKEAKKSAMSLQAVCEFVCVCDVQVMQGISGDKGDNETQATHSKLCCFLLLALF